MTAWAYYNEFDARAAAWLRELIADGLIAPGDVDERSIRDVETPDLKGYRQCHFFAGIGGWSRALRLAGWPDAAPVWTGSCPCQPFSCAGKHGGSGDKRHLFPVFARLIAECHPPTVFGEQVASAAGREWFSGVRTSLEYVGYSVGAADLCAASVGAPHIRQRLFWVADADKRARGQGSEINGGRDTRGDAQPRTGLGCGGDARRLADAGSDRRGQGTEVVWPRTWKSVPRDGGDVCGVGDADGPRLDQHAQPDRQEVGPQQPASRRPDARGHGFWGRAIWLRCSDGKSRRVEPAIQPLAHGLPGRVGLLRGAGNAITPQVAAEFVAAWMEAAP